MFIDWNRLKITIFRQALSKGGHSFLIIFELWACLLVSISKVIKYEVWHTKASVSKPFQMSCVLLKKGKSFSENTNSKFHCVLWSGSDYMPILETISWPNKCKEWINLHLDFVPPLKVWGWNHFAKTLKQGYDDSAEKITTEGNCSSLSRWIPKDNANYINHYIL